MMAAMVLSILSVAANAVCCLGIVPFLSLPAGAIGIGVSVLATLDLRSMKRGTMDRSGTEKTHRARGWAMAAVLIATAMFAVWSAIVWVVFFVK